MWKNDRVEGLDKPYQKTLKLCSKVYYFKDLILSFDRSVMHCNVGVLFKCNGA